ncbi:hypothetical protein [Tabrizicola sp.]|jgi:hypothetical protein|uniref:hypothetical protein n=1 Tax=Tabrizicola sp. TaxID=2005166 RepID=UPI001A37E850|nr:hypothetical protein [Tabrizicola sp.]MBL9061934.1 hypothetical protein [Tabrizicola sp.]
MRMFLSLAAVVATAFGTEWLVGSWLGEAWRFWVGVSGAALAALAGALVKASGIGALTRYLRTAVIGAGVGAMLDRTGLRLGWLRRGLWMAGVDTERERRPQPAPAWSGTSEWLLRLGWAGTLVGIGMVWTGMVGG